MRTVGLPNAKPLPTAMAALLVAVAIPALATDLLPPERQQGSVSYVSGGIGVDEAKAMEKAESRYPLTVEFVHKLGNGHAEYLAGDDLVIRDTKGRIDLNTVTDGPFLLANLPPGKYEIDATDNGKSEHRTVRVKANAPARVVFQW